MASLTGFGISMLARPSSCHRNKVGSGNSGTKLVASSNSRQCFPLVRLQQRGPMRLLVSCSAKPETVDKVCDVVRKQLSLPEGTAVNGESLLSALGADSLDTVEIVMGLEEAFEITVEEDRAQGIATVQDAAELIEKLVSEKAS